MDFNLTIDQRHELQNLFVCDNFIWYQYVNNIWYPLENPHITIKKYIREHFGHVKHIHLHDIHFLLKRPVEKGFFPPFDKDPKHLFCFNNGVYDFKLHKFRSCYPTDCCTLSTKYIYKPTYNTDLWVYLRKVFPDVEDYIQFMYCVDQLFKGNQRLIYAINNGNSGTLYRLINQMFGQYAFVTDINKLNSRKPYSFETELEYLAANFKGRYITFESLNNVFNINFTSVLTAEKRVVDTNNIIDGHKLKSTFSSSSSLEEKYAVDIHLTKQFPSLALTLMTKLISIQDSGIRYLYFNDNNIFIKDITGYILQHYINVIYL